MALATLSIDLVAKLAQLQTGMDKAGRIAEKNAAQIEARYKRMGDVARSVGAALGAAISVAGLTAFVKNTIDGIDALNDLKDATGSSIENLSALEDIAARTGTTMDTVGTALVKLNQVLNTSKPGSETAEALKAIGLSADELKKLDPAEALRQVSVALSGYADDGEKARLVQLLFGKSIREVAPLLKDLAEAGRLNATVTTAQALEAERFNQQLFALEKNVSNAARAITSELLPALNKYLEAVTRLPQNIDILGAGTRSAFESETLKLAVARVERLQEALNRNPGSVGLATQLADARRNADALLLSATRANDALRSLLPQPAEVRLAGGGRGFVNPEAARSSVPSFGGADVAGGRAGKRGPGYPAGLMGPPDPNDYAGTPLITPLSDATRDALRAIESTNVAKIKAINAALDELFSMRSSGAGSGPDVDQAIENLRDELQKLGPAAQDAAAAVVPALQEIDQFAQEAARNIQDALGDTMLATLEGDFDSIGRLWERMLKRLVAEAAAAELNKYLFGKNGNIGGAIAGLFSGNGVEVSSSFFNFLDGFRANGGPVSANKAYIVGERGPELMVPRTSGTVLPNGTAVGGGTTFNVNVQGDASENTIRLIRGALAQFEARQMMRGAY